MTPPSERSVTVGDLTLSLRERSGGEPAIVALHGLASNARWWDLVGARLAPERRFVALDQRGHGLSDKPDSGYEFDACVADVLGVVDALGIEHLVIAGHSWGASVALAFAAAHPDRVIGAVCVDGGVADLRSIFGATWEAAGEAMRPPNLVGITERQLRNWVEMSPLADASDAATGLSILMGNFQSDGEGGLRPRLTVERHMEIARHLYETDPLTVIDSVTCPVLLVMAALGRAGVVSSETHVTTKRSGVDRALEHLQGRGATVWIEGEHDLPVQRPEEVATAIAAFLDALSVKQ